MVERYKGGAERTTELEQAAAERTAELREQQEKHTEHNKEAGEHAIKEARLEAEKQARPTEEYGQQHEVQRTTEPTVVTARTREKSYKQTMQSIQRGMSPAARTFSKVIHNKTVEAISETAGKTIARPNAILSGSICAFILVLALYAHARYLGYALQGSETIIAFVLGWIIGIVFDFLRVMVSGKR